MTATSTTSTMVAGAPKSGASIDPAYLQVRDLIYKAAGIFQPEDKFYLLVDSCAKRIKELGLASIHDYLKHLGANPSRDGEIRQLLNEVTIGETCMFRSPPQIDALRKVILPEFTADKTRQIMKKLRVWSAGCSTGEEPYTLAMVLMDECEGQLKGWQFEVFATDLNDRSIETAKMGIYGDYALRNTSEHFRRKYFTPVEGGKLQVKPEVKKFVNFSRLNLQDDTKMLFMKGMDLVCCCNVLIYFDAPSKSRVISHYFNNLNLGGYFFLGTSESLLHLNDQFQLIHFPGAIGYWKPSLAGKKP